MKAADQQRLIIYQVFPRILTNECDNCVPYGSLEQNGSGKLNDFSEILIKSIKNLGCNAIWFTGAVECATKTDFSEYGIPADNPNVVKGEAGSPYAIKDYYDISPAIAVSVPDRMKEFEDAVKRIHREGLKVLIDFVPNHTSRVYHSDVAPEGAEDFGAKDNISYFFSPSNNYYYITNQQFSPTFPLDREGKEPYIEFPAKATGNDCFTAFCSENDWYETVKLNYGHDYSDNSDHFTPIPDTWRKMRDILLFWCGKGVDGFRWDMVFMVPVQFWNWVIPIIKKQYPATIFIGEIYDISQYRNFLSYGHFDYLYDKVNLYDTLVGIERFNVSAAKLTGCWQAVDDIRNKMLNFLENHDEVRFGSKEFAGDPTRVIPYLVVSSMISSAPYMIYYGQELGESATENEGFAGYNNRTTIFDYWSYASMRRWFNHGKCDCGLSTEQEKWLRSLYAHILGMLNKYDALRIGNLFDLMYVNLQNKDFNPHSTFAFFRHTPEQIHLIIANFSTSAILPGIIIPEEAFTASGLVEGRYEVRDLLADVTAPISATFNLDFKAGGKTFVPVGPCSAVVLEISLPNKQTKNKQKL